MSKQFHSVLQGDVRKALATLPDGLVDCVMTSPPYWGLRDYKIEPVVWDGVEGCEHEWGEELVRVQSGGGNNGVPEEWQRPSRQAHTGGSSGQFCSKCSAWKGQLGLEPTFQLYVKHIVDVFHQVKRVLKKTGCLYLNLGDTYNGSGERNPDKWNFKEVAYKPSFRDKQLSQKCLIGIPERIMLGLIDDEWILRNKIIWHKPNHMPSSVKDRFSNGWEAIYFFVKQARYWFDLDAVREPHTTNENRPHGIIRAREWGYDSKFAGLMGIPDKPQKTTREGTMLPEGARIRHGLDGSTLGETNPSGKNPSDFWTVNTQPFPEAHFATFPEKLVERPIKASCPAEICITCGKARERIVEKQIPKMGVDLPADYDEGSFADNIKLSKNSGLRFKGNKEEWYAWQEQHPAKTLGWTTCSCSEKSYRAGIVLDPFAGSGTVALVAKSLQRSSISIEIKPEYVEILKRRIGFGEPTINDSIEWHYTVAS